MRFFLLWLMLALMFSCVEELYVDPRVSDRILVVDGEITDGDATPAVRLSYLRPGAGVRYPERGATVSIKDDHGNEAALQESEAGYYTLSDQQDFAVAGHSYTLGITTLDGRIYESTPEVLQSGQSIDSLFFVYERDVLNFDDLAKPHHSVTVFVKPETSESDKYFYRWRWSGTYEIETFPKDRTKREGPPPGRVPDPPLCASVVLENGEIVEVGKCSCCRCWVDETSSSVSVLSYFDNINKDIIEIDKIPVDTRRFNIRFFLTVEQLSMTRKAYDFFKAIEKQKASAGDIFQPNTTVVRGNIRSVSHPEEEVLGLFTAYGVFRKSLFIDTDDLPERPADAVRITDDCRKILNSTNEPPAFW